MIDFIQKYIVFFVSNKKICDEFPRFLFRNHLSKRPLRAAMNCPSTEWKWFVLAMEKTMPRHTIISYLRLIGIVGIIWHHYFRKGGIIDHKTTPSINQFLHWLLSDHLTDRASYRCTTMDNHTHSNQLNFLPHSPFYVSWQHKIASQNDGIATVWKTPALSAPNSLLFHCISVNFTHKMTGQSSKNDSLSIAEEGSSLECKSRPRCMFVIKYDVSSFGDTA